MRFFSIIMFCSLLGVTYNVSAQLLTPNKHDNPAEKDFAMHIAVGYSSSREFQYYHMESGLTFHNKWFGLHFKYQLSFDDLAHKKLTRTKNKFSAVPDFAKRTELGGGVNIYSREGSSQCFSLLFSGDEDGIFKEIWGVGDGTATVYGQIRGGIGMMSFTTETEAIYSEPQYYQPADNWHMDKDYYAYIHTHTPYAYVGWGKMKKFNKECGSERVGLHKMYFDFLFGRPAITGIFNDNGNDTYNGYYPIMTFASGGWRIGYEAIRMNYFSGYLSIEAGYYPGIRDASVDDGLLYATMRFGFSSGPIKSED
jgi:hypothetical protein